MAPLRKTLIFVPTTDDSINLERRLNKLFPGTIVAQRIHASLTAEYKTEIIEDYMGPQSKPPILITTTLLSNVSLKDRIIVRGTYNIYRDLTPKTSKLLSYTELPLI